METFEALTRLWYPPKGDVPLRPNWVKGSHENKREPGSDLIYMCAAVWMDRRHFWVSGYGATGKAALEDMLRDAEATYVLWATSVGNPIFYTQEDIVNWH